ncbi:MAG: phosphatidate cytidylyltransferase, partial [Acidobacteriota bacterium]
MSAGRQRIITGLTAAVIAVASTFLMPPWMFVLLMMALFFVAAREFADLGRHIAPTAPMMALPWLAIATGGGLWVLLGQAATSVDLGAFLVMAFTAVMLIAAGINLFSRATMRDAMSGVGLYAFGVPYVGLAIAALAHLQRRDPWLLILLCAIVWLGDTVAYYVGSKIGRRRLAPQVSPKKSWEGAIASFVAALLVTLVWSGLRHGAWYAPGLLLVAAVTAVMAQIGDLVESIFKRGAATSSRPGAYHAPWRRPLHTRVTSSAATK